MTYGLMDINIQYVLCTEEEERLFFDFPSHPLGRHFRFG